MKYRVWYIFNDGTSEDLLDKLFNSKEEAEEAALEGMGNYEYGNKILKMGGHKYSKKIIKDWWIGDESELED